MCPLTASDVLRIWELGERQGPWEQALTILGAACPEFTAEQLADLSLGQRDRKLFILHQWLFGPDLYGFVECRQCRERLEFSLRVPEFDDGRVDSSSEDRTFSAGGFDLRFRPPNSRDLLAAETCAVPKQARQLLIQRCLLDVRRAGTAVASTELPEPVLGLLAIQLSQCDPWQEVLLEMACPACGHRWQSLLDIGVFLWAELAALAKRLLREVHALACAYGWKEVDILALSARRRRAYLEMVGA